MPNLYYLPIKNESDRDFAKSLSKNYLDRVQREPNWRFANNLIITDCKKKVLTTLPGSLSTIKDCNRRYTIVVCNLVEMKRAAFIIFMTEK